MILPHEIAKREEARLALTISELSTAHLEVGGGVACHGGSAESWMNLVIGLGMDGPVTDAELDAIDAFYAARDVEPKIEVCPFADLSLARGLGARGFRLHGFETILCRPLPGAQHPTLPPGAVFEQIDPNDAATGDAFVSAHIACFAPDGGPKADAMADGARRMLRHPRTTAWLIRVNGELAGAGALETLDTLATLIAAGVLPHFRRRSLQRALIDYRCAVAREAGCTLATIGSDPQSATGRNALRAGFVTAYTKAILARPR
jgi:GNAT superfamily N-acetyltransferase